MIFILPIPTNWFRKKRNPKPASIVSNRVLHYNCARVYVGSYVGGGTNEFEKEMHLGYRIIDGEISQKKIRPVRVKQTYSGAKLATLQTYILYPKTETTTIVVTNGKRDFTIQLIKRYSRRSTMFKLRL